jgi:competence protein ComEA
VPEQLRGSIVVWGAAAVVVVLALLRLLDARGDPPAERVKLERPPAAAGREGAAASAVYVHVAGAVRRPGLFRVAAGARVARAIERAGGPARKAALAGVNLAARVQDGQQIVVPLAGPAGGAGPADPSAGPGGAEAALGVKPSLGSATIEQLDQIDGIGPTLAERIVEQRQESGGFASVEALGEVEGIGEKRLETLRQALQP